MNILKQITYKIAIALFGLLLFLLTWQILSSSFFVNQSILPSPIQVFNAIQEMNKAGILLDDIMASLGRILIGFFLAFLFAIFSSIIAYRFSKIYNIVKIVMNLLSSIPPIAWTPLAILWFGIGNSPAYFIVLLGAFFPMFSNFYAGIRGVDKSLIDAAKTLGASNSRITFKVIFPAALPQLFTGIRVGLNVAWFNVIAAELIGVKSGLGYKIQLNRQLLASENVIGLMLIIGVIGLLLTGLTFLISNLVVAWSLQDESRETWIQYRNKIIKYISKTRHKQLNKLVKAYPSETSIHKDTHLLSVNNISKSYKLRGKENLIVFKDISFSVSKGEVISILGPNGSGKTTIINLIAGLLKPDSGSLTFENKAIISPSSERTVVFQNFSLFPWLNAKENIRFAIDSNQSVTMSCDLGTYLKKADLEEFSESYPFQLSGGMKQRLALMRAIAVNPKLILMDEPFASFDPLIRNRSQENILKILKNQHETTVLIVTHDIDEAIFMSDRIIVLSKRPSSIKEIVAINLGRPRVESIRFSKEFISKRAYIWQILHNDVQ